MRHWDKIPGKSIFIDGNQALIYWIEEEEVEKDEEKKAIDSLL